MVLGLFILIPPHACEKFVDIFLLMLPFEDRVCSAKVGQLIDSFRHESVEHILVEPFASFAPFAVAKRVLGEVEPGLKPHLPMIIMIVGVVLMRRCIGDTEIEVVLNWH